jgi:hypothetical protein
MINRRQDAKLIFIWLFFLVRIFASSVSQVAKYHLSNLSVGTTSILSTIDQANQPVIEFPS